MTLLKKYKIWKQKKKDERELTAYNNGYDYAAGAILRQEHTQDSLAQYGIYDWGHWHTKFELGMLDAIARLQQLNVIPFAENRP